MCYPSLPSLKEWVSRTKLMTVNDLTEAMLVVVVCVARSAGMVFFLPLLTGHPVSSRFLKGGIMLAFSAPVIFIYHDKYNFIHVGTVFFTILLAKEFFIGLCISFTAAIPFWAIEIAGFFIDTMRGATMSELFNVMMKTQTSLFGVLFSLVINVLFLSVGGLNILLRQLYESYVVLPILPFRLYLSDSWSNFFEEDIKMVFTLALIFSLPAILVMLINDIVLGLINVSAKELNVFNLSMPIKSILAIFMVVMTINYSIPHFINEIYKSDVNIKKVVLSMR